MIVDLDAAAPGSLGGKGAGLARLVSLGLPVPPTVVVPVEARGELGVRAADVAARLGQRLAVRSSSVAEDTRERSAAGMYVSLMDVRPGELADAVRTVWMSAGSDRARAYAGREGDMAVVIQRQVAASRAGVAFSRDPLAASGGVLIESVFGHGERLVSGLEDPDLYTVSLEGTVEARIAERNDPSRLLRTLRDDEAWGVASMTRQAEVGFGYPVDVEFCFEGPTLWLVQCRAITTSPVTPDA